jgi:hypothetical protein
VWPATAAAFGLLEPARARRTLSALGSHALTADWGARMLSTASPLYDPAHYNMGAVWPFVTGFLALGHYQYQRPWAGYALIDALARLGFDWARGRHPELLSGDRYRPLDTAVPQQFFASSMLVSPIVYGLLGFEPDAPAGRARLAPQLPPDWDRLRICGLGVGKSRLDVVFERRPGGMRIELRPKGPPLVLELRPMPPPGARSLGARVDGRSVAATPVVSVALDGSQRVVELRWAGGLEVEPPRVALEPGQRDEGTRVLEFTEVDGGFRLAVEGPSGSTATLRLHGERPAGADSGTLRSGRGVTELEITFPGSPERFSRTEIRLRRP